MFNAMTKKIAGAFKQNVPILWFSNSVDELFRIGIQIKQ